MTTPVTKSIKADVTSPVTQEEIPNSKGLIVDSRVSVNLCSNKLKQHIDR